MQHLRGRYRPEAQVLARPGAFARRCYNGSTTVREGGGTLDLDAYQSDVATFVREHGGFFPPLSNLARLTEEVGELARLLNARFGPKRPKEGEILPDLEEELGDILFVLSVMAAQLDVPLAAAGTKSLEKARRRDATRFSP